MNAEDLVITFKWNMAKLSRAERRRAIESVREVICAAAFDDTADSAYEVECCLLGCFRDDSFHSPNWSLN